MNIDEQVNYLMQGADFGDKTIADNMAVELRDRLIEAEKLANRCVFIAATTLPPPIFISGIPSPCVNSANSRSLGMKCSS